MKQGDATRLVPPRLMRKFSQLQSQRELNKAWKFGSNIDFSIEVKVEPCNWAEYLNQPENFANSIYITSAAPKTDLALRNTRIFRRLTSPRVPKLLNSLENILNSSHRPCRSHFRRQRQAAKIWSIGKRENDLIFIYLWCLASFTSLHVFREFRT